MPTTRKKVIKTVYKDENDSEDGDFSDSGSEAEISAAPSSDEDDNEEAYPSSDDDFVRNSKKHSKDFKKKKPQFAKAFINKINKQSSVDNEEEEIPVSNFSVKDLTEADKLLPSFLNLSESDSSDDESPKEPATKKDVKSGALPNSFGLDIDDNEAIVEYKDVWSNNEKDASEEIAKKTFLELEQHKAKIEEAKKSVLNYSSYKNEEHESDVKDLLAQGEEVEPEPTTIKKRKKKKPQDQSDSELDDWEEVKESKAVPQQGLQLIVGIPDSISRKKKKIDVEMMMKRKMNRVKKEYQVYMHKVHVLCWLGHGNYISTVLNDQEVMSATLSLVPSKQCYPGERVDIKYVEQITTWYKDIFTLKQDKHEGKFRPKAPPLKDILLQQIKKRTLTSKKYVVYLFVAMLRAIGLQCRIMLNFITVPIKPPASELHSLSTKNIQDKNPGTQTNTKDKKCAKRNSKKATNTTNISQLDGNNDHITDSDSSYENIIQLDGNNDVSTVKTRSTKSTTKENKKNLKSSQDATDEGVSPPKRSKTSSIKSASEDTDSNAAKNNISLTRRQRQPSDEICIKDENVNEDKKVTPTKINSNNLKKSKSVKRISRREDNTMKQDSTSNISKIPPKIVVTAEEKEDIMASKFFTNEQAPVNNKNLRLSRKRSLTANSGVSNGKSTNTAENAAQFKTRAKSTPSTDSNKSKYFKSDIDTASKIKRQKTRAKEVPKEEDSEDELRVSHRDLSKKKGKAKNDVTADLMQIIKKRVKEAKTESKQEIVKGKVNKEFDNDSDYLPEEDTKRRISGSDDDFKPVKVSPKPSTSRKIDRRVLSQDEEVPTNKIDVWCEIFVEELEEWIAVDVIRSKVHCVNEIYSKATHPVTYIVGWDNNNYLKDLTRRYVPHWNTVTRKQRVEIDWWDKAIQPWLAPKTARDREEDERLDRMQLEAPLPKSIAEYKNHPLYALKRHLLKYEVIYPPDAATLGFVRGEPVYARECVYICRSRDTWLKEAKVVRLGEQPYKVVKARPKWDRLSNKLITDKPLEIFGPWQVQDYEPPVAENGIVPRNAYGNVELFKDCMLPKGTVHIKLPGLNRVAKKLNIDCAPAMTGFDFNGGWTHPVFDGFIVCKEFEEIITEAWLKDQEDQERKEREKIDTRVYGNWRKLIKGLLIRERLKVKYGFDNPGTSQGNKKKAKAPRLVVKKTK
ncbi:unnamed protein product [Parnassius apollo]|uniref:(apollo) hypothetical protein n=1 Tax=Parnassius apollo TaxID=110799 RepID=A0A8S3WKX0_PARAO|nr:unnamed protein product [Parnassius apollo]